MRRLERRERGAALLDPAERRVRRDVDPEAARVVELGHEVAVGEAGGVAVAEAARAAVRDAGQFDMIWCLGDMVGYGPNPNECLARLREYPHVCLAGNHDLANAYLQKTWEEKFGKRYYHFVYKDVLFLAQANQTRSKNRAADEIDSQLARLRNEHRFQILLKGQRPAMRDAVRDALVARYGPQRWPGIAVDVDPLTVM